MDPEIAEGLLARLPPGVEAAWSSFITGGPVFFMHLGVTALILLIAVTLYALLTPHRELRLIRAGNTAAAISFGGAVIGLAVPLAFCMATSLNWADIAIWGAVTVLIQLFAFRFVDLLLSGLPRRIREGETAAATLLAAVKIAVSVLLAAAVTGAPLARI